MAKLYPILFLLFKPPALSVMTASVIMALTVIAPTYCHLPVDALVSVYGLFIILFMIDYSPKVTFSSYMGPVGLVHPRDCEDLCISRPTSWMATMRAAGVDLAAGEMTIVSDTRAEARVVRRSRMPTHLVSTRRH
jgi:hypothetical protein